MESSGDGDDDEGPAELDWLQPEEACGGGTPGRVKVMSLGGALHHVIVHLDLDCFYAQVETISNPELRGKPLGVHQKNLVVTSNYEARNLGVKKTSSVKEAIEKCPELVLVNGEDLTKYREMSYKVTALLEEFTPLVERLGLDENFVDVTKMAEKRLEEWGRDPSQISISGHVYNNQTVNLHDPAHIRLAAGSQIAAEMREFLHTRLGLTGCAGVASNKMLSKLVSGTFKPNQQTVLLPESRQDLMASHDHITKVPGIGLKTARRLADLGLTTVGDLQTCSPAVLEKVLGVWTARHLQKLSHGEDNSPVSPSGPPQSLSDEDSFRKCTSEAEVEKKVGELISNLLVRLHKDGRKPHTIKLSLRQIPPSSKLYGREGRQCPIPSHLAQRIGTDDPSIQSQLVALAMKLFHKMINVKAPFHLTLLNVCFSNLKAMPASTKQSIEFYLTRPLSSSNCSKLVHKKEHDITECGTPEGQVEVCETLPGERNASLTQMPPKTPEKSQEQIRGLEFPCHLIPSGIDHDVFNQLPRDIREEIISSQKGERNVTANVLSRPLFASEKEQSDKAQGQMSRPALDAGNTHLSISSLASSDTVSPNDVSSPAAFCFVPRYLVSRPRPHEVVANAPANEHVIRTAFNSSSPVSRQIHHACDPEPQKQTDAGAPHNGRGEGGSECALPSGIDAKTFSELPAEVQKELLVEWERRKPVSKICAVTTPTKLKTKKSKGLPSPQKSNSLLRYFKPA